MPDLKVGRIMLPCHNVTSQWGRIYLVKRRQNRKMGRRRLWMPLIQKLRSISNKLCTYLKVKPTNHFLVVLIRPTYLDGISCYTLHSSAIILLRLECPRLWRITDLSLVVNKHDQRTMKTAIKNFLAFPSFQRSKIKPIFSNKVH